MKIPQSLSVNNTDHSKGINIFLLCDRICWKSKSNIQSCLSAINTLAVYDIDKQNNVNYKTVIIELSKSLNKIKFQSVLIKVLDLLQWKGDELTIHHLRRFIAAVHNPKNTLDAFLDHNNLNLINRECTQKRLKECINSIEKNIKLSSLLSDRKPFRNFANYHRSHIKSATRTAETPSLVNKSSSMPIESHIVSGQSRQGKNLHSSGYSG